MPNFLPHSDFKSVLEHSDLVIVGSGFFGSVMADVASRKHGLRSTIIEKRSHIGGNAFSFADRTTGIEVHQYGSHLFHTSNQSVIDWVNEFVVMNNYVHRVFSEHNESVYSLPINLHTLCQFFGLNLSPREGQELLDSLKVKLSGKPRSLYEKGVSSIGTELFDAFFAGYTRKQWELDPRDLPAGVISRLPIRFNFDSRYFSEEFQGVPIGGYGRWFDKILDNKDISTFVDLDYFSVRDLIQSAEIPVVYSGPIDRYFDYSQGKLGWRTLDFEWETHESVADYQGCAVMNFADATVPYTRIHEFKHLHPEEKYDESTIIAKEYSRQAGKADEPYYPVNTAEDRSKLERYRALARSVPNVVFGGRLGSYQYLDMHMAIASALSSFETEVLPLTRRKHGKSKP
jgi:UDP-galactopyranose mutase